ncbi:hypothetical protein FHS59_001183 [Algoriphagus iocasae]|uniref:Uncharacterized protein n=1 Tax=Algoriphagus iocasae TaxID=1836499 RepID=A0A841MSH3_9BACT|nr:hypothetical protein [Algoriphagus iocasae]
MLGKVFFKPQSKHEVSRNGAKAQWFNASLKPSAKGWTSEKNLFIANL